MIALIVAAALSGQVAAVSAQAVVHVAPAAADVAPHTTPPADAKTAVVTDERVATLPAEVAIAGAGLAALGGAALVLGLATPANNAGERTAQGVATGVGVGLLAWAGLVESGALALWFFDPQSGTPRVPIDGKTVARRATP